MPPDASKPADAGGVKVEELVTSLAGLGKQLRRMVEGAAFVREGYVRVRDPDYLIGRLEQGADRIQALTAENARLTERAEAAERKVTELTGKLHHAINDKLTAEEDAADAASRTDAAIEDYNDLITRIDAADFRAEAAEASLTAAQQTIERQADALRAAANELGDDEILADAIHRELAHQQAFSIEKHGKIALAEAPFINLIVEALIARAVLSGEETK